MSEPYYRIKQGPRQVPLAKILTVDYDNMVNLQERR
jgi:hypothetical protein